MSEIVSPWETAPGGPGSEALESMDWANGREPDPPELTPEPDQQIPQSKEAVVTVVRVDTGTNKAQAPYADITVENSSNGEMFRVRTVKLYEDVKDLEPGSVLRIRWFESGPYKNLATSNLISDGKPAGAAKTSGLYGPTGTIVVSAENPAEALDALMTEWYRRAAVRWKDGDGKTVDVKDMDNAALCSAITECKRLCGDSQ